MPVTWLGGPMGNNPESIKQGVWNTLLSVDWEDMPFSHERDDGLGWHYRDQPHGGLLIVAETTAYFHHPKDDPDAEEIEVKLGIGVEFIDWKAAVGDPGYLADAKAIIHPDSLSAESVEDVAGSLGATDRSELGYYDVAQYGYCVPMRDAHSPDGWQDAYEQVKPTLAVADMGVGFVLDTRINRLGTTGWDVLRDGTGDVDMHEAALQRAHEQQEP